MCALITQPQYIRWEIIKNREYLRSIHGKILTLEKLCRVSEEISEREQRLLAMEPEDHLQVRYRIMQSKMMSQDVKTSLG